MTGTLSQIWRHPIKSHGREQVPEAELTEAKCLPLDRQWAVAHESSCFDVARPQWQPCSEFSRGAKSPRLQAITAQYDAVSSKLTLSHPDRVDITLNPDDADDANFFIQWVMPISNGARMLPARLVRGSQAMTDTDFASISIINLASHRALEAALGKEISDLRWRGNLLVDGWDAWAEREMIGKQLQIGNATLEIREDIVRCTATMANIKTGERDTDTLKTLKSSFGHQEMGVYAVVTNGGTIQQGDQINVIGA